MKVKRPSKEKDELAVMSRELDEAIAELSGEPAKTLSKLKAVRVLIRLLALLGSLPPVLDKPCLGERHTQPHSIDVFVDLDFGGRYASQEPGCLFKQATVDGGRERRYSRSFHDALLDAIRTKFASGTVSLHLLRIWASETPIDSSRVCGRPGWTRTSDVLLRRQVLYPPELRAHKINDLRIRQSQKYRLSPGSSKNGGI